MVRPKHTVWTNLAKLNKWVPISGILKGSKNGVLMYHSIGNGYGNPDGNVLPENVFYNAIKFLDEMFDVVDLPSVIQDQPTQDAKKKVALTFDDAYLDFYESALPVLREYDVPATLFVISECIGQAGPADVTSAPGEPSFMTATQLQEVADGDLVTIGNHTKTHRDLAANEDEDTLHEEILGGKRALESRFGTTVDRFCYPGGKFNDRCAKYVEQSHSLAVTVRRGLVSANQDPYRIPRIDGNQPEHQIRWALSDFSDSLWRL